VVCDALAAFGGFLLAVWIRFDSGWIRIIYRPPEHYHALYAVFGGLVALLGTLVLRYHGLYVRPQTGRFTNKIPRLIKACVITMFVSVVALFTLQNEWARILGAILRIPPPRELDIARLVVGLACATVPALVLLERYVLFRVEWNLARHSRRHNQVLIVGTDAVAARLKRTFATEHMLRARVVGFLRANGDDLAPGIAPGEVLGALDELEAVLDRLRVDQLILTSAGLGTERMLDMMLLCERRLVTFNVVPDLFHLMTTSMDVQSLNDIPLLGVSAWPLDYFWNRVLKRIEDIVGACLGLILSAPVMAVAALFIKRASPGPVFYRQERCGEHGQTFHIYKLRTMQADAERDTGPVFASADDARRTPIGAFLRRTNLDELPQLWNVLKGEMSLVGPRPERPHFVEQFKTEISRYMWRHVSKPGMTGWAQINGLRGDTSIAERVKYDLYYLENWSLAFDFKILLQTVLARDNAY
jgi:exopolysaccharide biosynthesis polyprenyl glycosylphosphotransferase